MENDQDAKTAAYESSKITLAVVESLRLNTEMMLIEAQALVSASKAIRDALEQKQAQLPAAMFYNWVAASNRYVREADCLSSAVDEQNSFISQILEDSRQRLIDAGIDNNEAAEAPNLISELDN